MIVWLTGSTSAGKTWLGDFLRHYHDFNHIDGDKALAIYFSSGTDFVKNLYKSFEEYWFDYKEAPLELWVPYYKDLCDQIAECYQKTPEKSIVLSFSTYPRVVRDYVREEIKRLTGEDLIMIFLDMSKEDYARRQYAKLLEWCRTQKTTIQQVWEDSFKLPGKYTEEGIRKFYQEARQMKGLEPIQADEQNSYTIDTNDLHVKVVPEITRILQLKECPDFDNEVIMKLRTERLEEYKVLRDEIKKNKTS